MLIIVRKEGEAWGRDYIAVSKAITYCTYILQYNDKPLAVRPEIRNLEGVWIRGF